jgi:ABC-type transport system involved in Fe-S cluster assembly fused permease/ATPase subunit
VFKFIRMFYESFFFFNYYLCDYSYFQAFLGSSFSAFESKIRQKKNYFIVEQKRNKKSFEKPYQDLSRKLGRTPHVQHNGIA